MRTIEKDSLDTHSDQTKQTMNYRFDKVVTMYSYIAILGLVIYMVGSIIGSFVAILSNFPALIDGGFSYENMSVQTNILHTIAFTIILIKAYTVMISYATTKHLSPKYLIEIGIIASIVEIIFNLSSYDQWTIVFLWSFSVVLSIVYLYFYDTLRQAAEDHKQTHT